VGEVELEGRIIVLKRIRVQYRLKVEPDEREAAERAHEIHVQNCPVARSIGSAVAIATELVLEEG
jgi:uncharacterized OsmC-like protein